MLKRIVFAIALTGALSLNAQETPLLTIGEENVSKEEFLAVYNKNNIMDSLITQESIDEYMELYINFKLKVKEAESLGLHNKEKFQKEFEGYKNQLSQSYLEDKEVTEDLVKEAYERMKYEIHASHILLEMKATALPEDTLKTYNEVLDLKKRIEKGEDFETLAKKYSNDPSAQKNGGDLGWYSALKMVYPFETASFNTPVGEVSNPVRTRFGYHIIKIHEKRESTGEWKAAHIMIKTPKDKNEQAMTKAENLIREIHSKLEKGESFASLAKSYSDDPSSARKAGELPWFRTNTYPSIFEKNCFELANNGDYSEPFLTDYGWHIVKRIDHRPMESFEQLEGQIRSKVARDSRSKLSKEVVITRIKNEYGFKEYKNNLKAIIAEMDSSFFEGTWSAERGGKMKKKLFVLENKKYTQKDFMLYLQEYSGRRKKGDFTEMTLHFYDKWVKETLLAHEEANLPVKYPEYKRQVQEYRDGILLFDLMDQKVWSKAIEDTLGLQAFHEAHKNDFMWDKRVEANIYTCEDESTDLALRALLADTSTSSIPNILKELNKDSNLKVRVDQGKYEIGDKEILEKIEWKVGLSESVNLNGKVYVVEVIQVLDPMPKELNEAKGKIIAAYQNHLDAEWIKELREKYNYSINTEILNSIVPQ